MILTCRLSVCGALTLILCCTVLSCTGPAVQDQRNARQLAAAVVDRHNTHLSHQASFVMRDGGASEPGVRSGDVFYARSGVARWDFTRPSGLYLSASPESESWWRPDTREYCVREGRSRWFELAALAAGRPDATRLVPTSVGADARSGAEELGFTSQGASRLELTAGVLPDSLEVRYVTFATTLIVFEHHPPKELDLTLFSFTPPADAREHCALPQIVDSESE